MKVFIVRRNADSTEGRGPMVLDSVWRSRKKAAAYIDGQPGVMGIREKWSEKEFGDWTIEEVKTRD